MLPLMNSQLMMPMMVLEIHSSQMKIMYTVTRLALLHALKVCFAAVKKVYSVTPRLIPHVMLATSTSEVVAWWYTK